jgi:hypothetical protein
VQRKDKLKILSENNLIRVKFLIDYKENGEIIKDKALNFGGKDFRLINIEIQKKIFIFPDIENYKNLNEELNEFNLHTID